MKRYTVFDPSLGRYVVPLSDNDPEPFRFGIATISPEQRDATGTIITSPRMDVVFGDVIDHLAGLEIAAEEAEKRVRGAGHQPTLVTQSDPPNTGSSVVKPYVRQDYICDNGKLAQIIIPIDATKDDLCALREMLEVLIKRRFKEANP